MIDDRSPITCRREKSYSDSASGFGRDIGSVIVSADEINAFASLPPKLAVNKVVNEIEDLRSTEPLQGSNEKLTERSERQISDRMVPDLTVDHIDSQSQADGKASVEPRLVTSDLESSVVVIRPATREVNENQTIINRKRNSKL